MISSQCDKLRERAAELRNLAPKPEVPYLVPSTKETMALAMMSAASEMEQVADLILELRDDLQRANAKNESLRKERDTYRDLVDCMVHPDIPDQLAAENAKLRTQLADVTESMGRVEERCAKLRELACHLWYVKPRDVTSVLVNGKLVDLEELMAEVGLRWEDA